MIPIVWRSYRAEMTGSVLKTVHCANCSTDYIYQMERTAAGGGTSLYMLDNQGASGRASASAESNLQSALNRGFDAVPCPSCGWYQDYMIPKMRRMKWSWLAPVNVALGIVGAIVFFASLIMTANYFNRQDELLVGVVIGWTLFALLWCIGIGLAVAKHFKFRRFDPNLEDQQARIAAGRIRAITTAEFEELQKSEPGES